MRSSSQLSASARTAFRTLALVALLASAGWALGGMVATDHHVVLNHGGQPVKMSTDTLLDWPLGDLTTGQPVSIAASKDYTLVIVLSASDCSSCLMETDQWNSLVDRHRDRLDVRGIVINSSPEEARDYTIGFTAAFPVFLGQDSPTSPWRSLERLTPLKVLVDRRRRPVLAETGGSPSNTFAQRVSKAIGDRR